MPVNVDRLNEQLLNDIAFRAEWRPIYQALKHLFDILNQNRRRTGGDDDIISAVEITADDTLLSAMESRIAELESLVSALQRENDHLSRIAALESRLDGLDRETAIPKPEPQTDMDYTTTLIHDLLARVKSLEVQI
jgi:predicted RNase H-like nuclease (RuvC/YqgF family)